MEIYRRLKESVINEREWVRRNFFKNLILSAIIGLFLGLTYLILNVIMIPIVYFLLNFFD